MKRTTLLLVLFLFSCDKILACGQQNNLVRCSSDTTIQVKVRLAQDVTLPAYCGVIYWTGTYKFELLDSAHIPTPQPKYISIKFGCPREMGLGFFEKGRTYHFLLQKEMIFSASKAKKQDDELPVYVYAGKY